MNASTRAPQPIDDMSLDKLCIATIRTLAMDAVEQAGAGHPGTAMAEAHLAAVFNRPGHCVVDHRTYVFCRT